jgi:hypothetical protein
MKSDDDAPVGFFLEISILLDFKILKIFNTVILKSYSKKNLN